MSGTIAQIDAHCGPTTDLQSLLGTLAGARVERQEHWIGDPGFFHEERLPQIDCPFLSIDVTDAAPWEDSRLLWVRNGNWWHAAAREEAVTDGRRIVTFEVELLR